MTSTKEAKKFLINVLNLLEYLKIAMQNIKSNKGRSLLTMLGIIIGISSVIMVMTVGNGVSNQMSSELEALGAGQIYLGVDTQNSIIKFTQEDFEFLEENLEHLKAVTPNFSAYGTALGPKGNFDTSISSGNEGLYYALKDPIVKGRYFTKEESQVGKRICVITENSARLLFGTTDVIGLSFELSLYGLSSEVTIVGLRKDSAGALINATSKDTVSVELPYTIMGNDFKYDIDGFNGIYLIAQSSQVSNEVAKKAVSLLENKYSVKGENQIIVQSFADVSSQINEIMDMVTLFIAFVAAISLLVGGIGVMNIMLVSVTERTREIGIRKALGARTGSILLQFMAEAGMITLLGGIIGILLGSLGGLLVCALVKVTPALSVFTVLGAALFSSGIGLFFGIYPAKKAAALSPIEALRHE